MAFWALVLGGLSFILHVASHLRRVLTKAELEFAILGFPEIGFSWFGPTISFWMLFRSDNKDSFVRKVALSIENRRTHERHDFVWLTFNELRHDPLVLNPVPTRVIKDIASGFYVTTSSPVKVNILFHDEATFYRQMRQAQDDGNQAALRLAQQLNASVDDARVRDRFNGSPEALTVWNSLNRILYWREAEYEMVVTVETNQQTASKKFTFAISQEDSNRIELNIATMSSLHPTDRTPPYQFAYPRLVETP